MIKLVTVLAKSDPADHAETRAYVFLTTECFYTKGCRSHATLLSELVLIFDLSCPAYHATGLRLLAAPFDQVPPLVWGNLSTEVKLLTLQTALGRLELTPVIKMVAVFSQK